MGEILDENGEGEMWELVGGKRHSRMLSKATKSDFPGS